VTLIVGNTPSVLAAKAATTTVPIIFASGDDPGKPKPKLRLLFFEPIFRSRAAYG
jgi:hypothetical protein